MQKTLAQGFQLRSISEGIATDRQRLPAFFVEVFTEAGGEQDRVVGPWAEDLLAGTHPTISDEDIWVVVDPAQEDRIISALLLIPQRWCYAGIEFGVGRVELVATHKDYRRRGLVRALMQVAHQRSQDLGHLVQVITGIPHYYRQFGYGMALDLGAKTFLPFGDVPPQGSEAPAYKLRPATLEDIPRLAAWYESYTRQCLVSVLRTPTFWRYQLSGRQPKTPPSMHYHIIESAAGQPVGYVGVEDLSYGTRFSVLEYIIGEDSSYLETFVPVMQALVAMARTKHAQDERQPHLISFDNGVHPAIPLMVGKGFPGWVRDYSYQWYVRVADLPQLLQQLAPIISQRLEGSGAQRFTGTIGLDFYDSTGIWMQFEQGQLVEAAPLAADHSRDGALPWHFFLSLLFGHRSLDELRAILPEVYCNRKARLVLEAAFPVQRSWIMGVF